LGLSYSVSHGNGSSVIKFQATDLEALLWCYMLKRPVRVEVTLRLAIYCQSFRLGAKPLETHNPYFFQLNTCGHSPYVTSSLTRGWVCRLQFMVVLASAVILESNSRGTHGHILRSQIRDSLKLEGHVPVFISTMNRVAQFLKCLSLMLRPTVSQSVYLGIKHPSGAYDQIFITVRHLRIC
jgi:hypothetical protein